MSVEVYSECRIQFDSLTNKTINFDRCLIELRQYDIGDYNLRAINLNNRKFEIFNWPLTHRNQYVFALSIEQPDILNVKNEICRIWLNRNSRDKFHEILRTCLEEFLIVKDNDTNYSSQLNNQEKSRTFLHELS
ncbi:unnamed protein product, partial [Adineta steineri]